MHESNNQGDHFHLQTSWQRFHDSFLVGYSSHHSLSLAHPREKYHWLPQMARGAQKINQAAYYPLQVVSHHAQRDSFSQGQEACRSQKTQVPTASSYIVPNCSSVPENQRSDGQTTTLEKTKIPKRICYAAI